MDHLMRVVQGGRGDTCVAKRSWCVHLSHTRQSAHPSTPFNGPLETETHPGSLVRVSSEGLILCQLDEIPVRDESLYLSITVRSVVAKDSEKLASKTFRPDQQRVPFQNAHSH